MLRRPLVLLVLAVLVQAVALVTPRHDAVAAPARRVTRVLIKKQEHTMQLLAADAKGNEEVVASYKVAIGPGGLGPKRQEGDMTTPVGRYHVTMRQRSQYKLFLGIDYPTVADHRRFELLKRRGDLPKSATIGGSIGIHGPPVALSDATKKTLKEHDWTAGCIAVDEDEITEIGRLVRDGTVVDIED
ncbi:MAG: L,D-transpeptidase family protein [Labilithrix sp.]|nr:L,D-transpeptidase family protein [Labilithrix sp.]